MVIHQIYPKRRNWTEDKSSLSSSHRSGKASDSLQQVHSGIPQSTLPCQGGSRTSSGLPIKMQHTEFHNQRLEQSGEVMSCQPGAAPWLPKEGEQRETQVTPRTSALLYWERWVLSETQSSSTGSIWSAISFSCQASGFLGSCEHPPGEEQTFL